MFFPGRNIFEKRKEKSSLPVIKNFAFNCRGRISLSTSQKGSLTLEAACVLPLFLFGMIAVMYFFGAIKGAGILAEELHETGKQMAVYAYAKEVVGIEEEVQAGKILSLLYVQNRLSKKAGNGIENISLLRSSILKEEMIDLVAEYKMKFRVPFFTLPNIRILQRARIRAWTGRSETEGAEGEDTEGTAVYVTVNGKVYHKDRECTHIRLSVQQVNKNQVADLRNKSGGKYYPCEGCKGGGSGAVYITDTGDRYHSSVSCSGLKRGVISVPQTSLDGWSPCSRCGG